MVANLTPMNKEEWNEFHGVDTICKKCLGTCYNKHDPAQQQKEVRKKYGAIPNCCIHGSTLYAFNGSQYCPYAKDETPKRPKASIKRNVR